MGMFNTIVADIPCPETAQVSKDTEIQIKWQAHEARILDVYRTGDFLPDLLAKYDNTWVRTNYIYNACSHKTTGYGGAPYIRTDDQCWHIAFVEIRSCKVCCILSESEFEQMGVDHFADDVWPPKKIAEHEKPGD